MDFYEVGDEIEFIGVIKLTNITPIGLFKYITIGNHYKILKIEKLFQGYYYKILTDNGYAHIYYPVENFRIIYRREYIVNKYNLR